MKNFPKEYDEAKLKELFSKYGPIKSLVIMKKTNKDGTESPFAFVCFDDQNDKEQGIRAAQNAVNELHDKEINGQRLYVRDALKKNERDAEKRREQYKFKNSKKKCNLYVKNFPPQTTEAQLRELFGRYGDIESVKLFPQEGDALYAFICFKSPDHAA